MGGNYLINKNIKRVAFNKAANSYDTHSKIQELISKKLFDRLSHINIYPNNILDLGSGTGLNGLLLQKKYRKSHIINYDFAENMLANSRKKQPNIIKRILNGNKFSYVCGDIEELGFAPNSFDLIWSSSAIQWCNDLSKILQMIKTILKPGGLFIFSSFGPNTLKELRAIDNNSVNTFIDVKNISDMLVGNRLLNPKLDVEDFTLLYTSIDKFFRDLKGIGASKSSSQLKKGLGGKDRIIKIKKAYEELRVEGKLPVTYEVIYGHVWKKSKNLKN
tara:strand:- start:4844 stop:5668 length:825 start_codon:yes stop_codon:yes gene_type:complete